MAKKKPARVMPKKTPLTHDTVFDLARDRMKDVFRRNVKLLRFSKNLSQEEAAVAGGTNRRLWNTIENGHDLPSFDTIIRISIALTSNISELFDPMTAINLEKKGVEDRFHVRSPSDR